MQTEEGERAPRALDSSLEEVGRLDRLAVNLLVLALPLRRPTSAGAGGARRARHGAPPRPWPGHATATRCRFG